MDHKAPPVTGEQAQEFWVGFSQGMLGKKGFGGRREQKNPTGALSSPSRFLGSWGAGLRFRTVVGSEYPRASQPQGRQEYPVGYVPVGMEKQEKEGKIGKNWGKVTLKW